MTRMDGIFGTHRPWFRLAGAAAGNRDGMAESYEHADLETLRAMARSRGIDVAEETEHDDLVEALRQAGLAEPAGSAPGEPDEQESPPGLYHGKGIGRRETIGGTE